MKSKRTSQKQQKRRRRRLPLLNPTACDSGALWASEKEDERGGKIAPTVVVVNNFEIIA